MARTDRRSARDLIAEIGEDAPHFRFFQAVRLLALSSQERSVAPVPASLRFNTPITLAFPASEVLAAQPRLPTKNASGDTAGKDEEDHGEHDARREALQLTVGFMGMTGPSGVLPAAYTETLIERRNFYRDTSAHSFLDVFSHRAISLFYQAWRKHRFYVAYEAGDRDRFTRNVLDLVGGGLTSLQSRLQRDGGIPDMFLSHFSGLLSQKPVSATSLAALLRGYFHVDAEVEQFVGQWISVPEAEQTCLGMASCMLGEDAFVGERIWDRQNKIRIRLGPLDHEQFADFLPGQPGAIALAGLVQYCVGQTLACDVTLSLEKECVPLATLGDAPSGQLQLGYNTWLHQRPPQQHRDDACFTVLD